MVETTHEGLKHEDDVGRRPMGRAHVDQRRRAQAGYGHVGRASCGGAQSRPRGDHACAQPRARKGLRNFSWK